MRDWVGMAAMQEVDAQQVDYNKQTNRQTDKQTDK